MTINLADNDPRVSYAVAAGATQSTFTVSFEFFVDADLNVYVDGVLKTLTTDYTVTGGEGSTGSISMSVTGASGGSTVVITRSIALERTTDFPSSGPFDIASLNEELDKFISIAGDLKDKSDRALQLTDFDTNVSLTLPDVNTRKGKLLAFNATSGAVEAGASTVGATTVAALSTDIETLADIEDGTVATDAISDLAAIASNVTTAAGIASNITTVAGISSDVTSVAADATDIGTVATDITNVNTVSTNIANVNTVATNISNINAVHTNATNINTVASDIANVNTVGGISSDVTTVSGISSNVTAVAGNATNINAVNSNATNINTVAGDSTDIGTLAAITTDITSLANALGASTTYTVTVSAGVYYLDGVANPILTFDRGNTYIFDLSDSTNTGHPLAFKDGSGNSYTTGVTTTGTAGSSGAQVQIDVDNAAPAALRYYCTVHGNGMGNTITVVNSNLALVASNITSVNSVASNATNINTAATNISGINTAATSISAINDFNDIFSAGSSAPSSPSAGDLWYDTANSELKVYVGSSFQIAGAYLQGLTSTHIFTATASQTDFITDDASNTMSIYANGNTLVFKNGVRLIEGSSSTNDYYIDGNTVKLNEACAVGDVILVEVFTKVSTTQETSLNALVTTAQGHANTATTQATTATTQATTATTQATAASTSATNAATSETNASTSATNASTSATNAATSETNAASSATSAASSASAAQAAANFEVVNDSTPTLGGDLDVDGNSIVSTSNGNIAITPNGTGSVVIDGLSHPQTDGTSGQFMKTDGSGNLSFGTVSTPTLSSLSLDNHDQLSVNASGDIALGTSEINFGTNGWSIEISSTDLVFKYNGTAKIKFANDGEIVTVDDVTAFGTI